jgi:F-type H+-transporting ATPase subunit gamma
MSRRQEIQERLSSLTDIGSILSAMKNLALMEVHKLTRFLTAQQQVVTSMETVAAQFLCCYPNLLPQTEGTRSAFVVIGSERGFCGDFNETLVTAFERESPRLTASPPLVIAVGHKLAPKLERLSPLTAVLDGPSVTEEVQKTLLRLTDIIRDVQQRESPDMPLDLIVLAHGSDETSGMVIPRRPFHRLGSLETSCPHPPRLYLNPAVFFDGLRSHYVFAALHEIFYSSLMTENRRRFQHMDQAIQRLDTKVEELTIRSQSLRQQEITQEIAVIMLSSEAMENSNENHHLSEIRG